MRVDRFVTQPAAPTILLSDFVQTHPPDSTVRTGTASEGALFSMGIRVTDIAFVRFAAPDLDVMESFPLDSATRARRR